MEWEEWKPGVRKCRQQVEKPKKNIVCCDSEERVAVELHGMEAIFEMGKS